MSIVLTPRDNLVLASLARAVRLLTLLQVATLLDADVANTRRRMKKLEKGGYVAERRIFAEPPPCLHRPLFVSNPGDPPPDEHQLHKIAYQAEKRYRLGPGPKHITAYVATRFTLHCFDGPEKRGLLFKGVDRSKLHQLSHDIGFAESFVRYRAWPKSEWVNEDLIPASERGHGIKILDGFICTDGDVTKPKAAIDFLGRSYTAPRIAELIAAIAERTHPIPLAFF